MTDPYLWLEDRNGPEAVQWAQAESNITTAKFEKDPRFQQCFQEIYDILSAEDRIPMVYLCEGYAYNLWQDETHQRGLWRRTKSSDYKNPNPNWEILIGLDELSEREGEPWVFAGSQILPDSDRCLVRLSKNNQDSTETREFSLSKKEFIKDGFFIPDSKSSCEWLDENRLLVALAIHEEQKTNSGYPRKVYVWTRGEELSAAKLVYEGSKGDVSIWPTVVQDQNSRLAMIGRYVNYDFMESYVLTSDLRTHKLPIPLDAGFPFVFDGYFFFTLRSDWKGFTAGSVLAISREDLEKDEILAENIQLVFAPTPRSSFEGFASTKKDAYLIACENVRCQIYSVQRNNSGHWQLQKLLHSENSYYISAVDKYSDDILFQEEGYLQARRLLLKQESPVEEIKKMRSYFKEMDFVTEQFWARSQDGVEIPYTVIRSKNLKYNGQNPTLLYGYGGFAISRTPIYNAVMGKAWLEQGGVYVMSNLRGGGEFGPHWHKSAMKENKQKSYDDFIAIAEDLISRKITSPSYLGIQGGSNGGLLVGAVTMQRPDLFNAVVCQIPLLDMLRYTKLPPGSSWVDEYGDPEDPKFREIIAKYSPYQNLEKHKKYPKIFFQTTQADDRVHPGHARKMAARMKEQGHEMFFYEALDGGHGGGGVHLQDQARVLAYIYVYLHQHLST